MFKRKFFFKLFLEVIAIVIGISVSFGINEMSNKRDQEIQKERVLNSILIESNDIKKYCDDRMKIWNQDIDIYNLLLKDELNFEKIKKCGLEDNNGWSGARCRALAR